MEKFLIIRRLNGTIKMLKSLKDRQFYFSDYVKKYKEKKNGTLCGTVCCVAGWYPKYFPKSEMVWSRYDDNNVMVTSNKWGNIDRGLGEYHGLSESFISALFYGNSLVESKDGLKLPSMTLISVTRKVAIERFQTVVNHIKTTRENKYSYRD